MNGFRGQSYSPVRVEAPKNSGCGWFVRCPRRKFRPINSKVCFECPKRPKCLVWRIECPYDESKVTGLNCAKCQYLSGCNSLSATLAEDLQIEPRPFDGAPKKGVQTILVEHVQRSLHLKRAEVIKDAIEKKKDLVVQKKKSRSRYTFAVKT